MLQFHFHWGPDKKTGSEHLLDGKSFAGEVHLVHINENPDAPASELLTVVGMFINEKGKSSKGLKKFIKAAKKVYR